MSSLEISSMPVFALEESNKMLFKCCTANFPGIHGCGFPSGGLRAKTFQPVSTPHSLITPTPPGRHKKQVLTP